MTSGTESLLPSPDSDEWTMHSEKATPLHIGPSAVTVDGERYYSEGQVVAALAYLYRTNTATAVGVAHVCDKMLDTRGRLLGIVRQKARRV